MRIKAVPLAGRLLLLWLGLRNLRKIVHHNIANEWMNSTECVCIRSKSNLGLGRGLIDFESFVNYLKCNEIK